MLRKLIIYALFQLIVVSLYSQTLYPKKVVNGNDTLILITPKQVTLINKITYERDFYETQVEIDSIMISTILDVCKSKEIHFENLKEVNSSNEKLLEKQIILNKGLEKDLERQKKRTKQNLIIGGVIGVITTILISIAL